MILACNDTFASLNYGERTRQTVRRRHTCVRRGAASVQSLSYHKNLLCAEWAAQWRAEWSRATGLVINLETAKSLGLEVLPALTVR